LVASVGLVADFGGQVFVELGISVETVVFGLEVVGPADQIELSDGEVLLVVINLAGSNNQLGLVLVNLELETDVLVGLCGNFVVEVLDVLSFRSLSAGEGVLEILLDSEEEVLDLSDGILVSEFLRFHADETLDEGGLGSLSKLLVDADDHFMEFTNLGQT